MHTEAGPGGSVFGGAGVCSTQKFWVWELHLPAWALLPLPVAPSSASIGPRPLP